MLPGAVRYVGDGAGANQRKPGRKGAQSGVIKRHLPVAESP
ncbi:MAG: hypothetical protein BSOLF_2776 [Candidatus Carbobacillus altaicus]|uniref:Uncharacterized protein n=1 Tax=Candidatus Carbonibacillus altaicus TaxID=2163959 RepID=A0A2R6Y260_9BACL|nr:MAG: hypothetical protein BSOLF_2776 [Candidatus Carbobacillus altaicus]